MQSREKVNYQYALLHMAILQADFGCSGEALAAIEETIATARENQDKVCLNYSLSWLYYFNRAHPTEMKSTGYTKVLGSKKEGLHFLKVKAREAQAWSQMSSALLHDAQLTIAKVWIC